MATHRTSAHRVPSIQDDNEKSAQEVTTVDNAGAPLPDSADAKETKVLSVELSDAVAKDAVQFWSRSQLLTVALCCYATLNGIMNGYDGSVMSSINAMDQWHDHFQVGKLSEKLGQVMAVYTAGQIIGSFMTGFIIDTIGRRGGMAVGSFFIIIGSVIQATANPIGAFIAGRLIVGVGVPMCATAAPMYIVEMAYPTWRGTAGGCYNVFGWYIGSLTASWTCYGTANISGNMAWRIPYIIQAVPAAFILATVYFILPESPRWLWQKGKVDKAKAILIKYHGDGKPDSALVALETAEIQASVEYGEQHDTSKWYNYKILVSTRPNLLRMYILFLIVVFSQFTGGAVISYYLPSILETVGITDSKQQLLMNALNQVFSFAGGIVGAAFFVDRWGRRPLMLWGIFVTGLIYIPINVLAALSNGNIAVAAGYVFIACIFSYGIVSSFCITPLQAMYPAEILSNDIRAKGIAADKVVGAVASFINMYATPVALKNIGWKAYTIFLVLHFAHWVMMYFVTVETKGRSLEEIEEIFNDPHPVKRSKQMSQVVIATGVGVKSTA